MKGSPKIKEVGDLVLEQGEWLGGREGLEGVAGQKLSRRGLFLRDGKTLLEPLPPLETQQRAPLDRLGYSLQAQE